MSTVQNGKGDKARNIFSESFRSGYDNINWGRPKEDVKVVTVKDSKPPIKQLTDAQIAQISY